MSLLVSVEQTWLAGRYREDQGVNLEIGGWRARDAELAPRLPFV